MSNRFELRKSRYTPVVITHDSWPWSQTLVASEVSPRGLFVSGDHVLPPDETVRVSFQLGSPDQWEFEARVVHLAQRRRRNDWGFSGVGLELLDARALDRMRMRTCFAAALRLFPWNVGQLKAWRVGDGLAERAVAVPRTPASEGPIGSVAG